MRYTFAGLIAAVFFSGLAATFAEMPETALDGQRLVAEAAERLDRQSSVEAKIRQRISLLGTPLLGVGSYAQLGAGDERLLRLEIKLQVAGQTSTMQQICDGRFLWLRRQLADGATLGRVDLRTVRQAAREAGVDASSEPGTGFILLGGLPELMKSLHHNFRFGAAHSAMLSEAPVWIVEGVWRPERLVVALPQSAEAIQKGEFRFAEAPPHMPERVVLTLDQNFLFPYRIEYLRKGEAASSGAGEGRGEGVFSILTTEFSEVRLGASLDPVQFRCAPGDLTVSDHTEMYLQKLGRK